MIFCPHCSNLLLIEAVGSTHRFYCQTCPYIFQMHNKVTNLIPLKTKVVDDVFGGKDAWKNVPMTDATCEHCGNTRAYFKQLQIRSADEPMTNFYKCSNPNCGKQWNE
eukprot:TRINITY_DN2422_c0_g1_i6.p1 TRINITY_DN2422_c0_g1~~TRINITY_DN2422_c0_g1_i6.p1  ORF type:complete len:108 (-),score=16.02 TRINITY_DN2422_c0_g1_i6:172-495(-)